MAFAPLADYDRHLVEGSFIEVSHKHLFEYSRARDGEFLPFGFDLKVYVGPPGDFRWAKVTASRAYLIVDENADGSPVIERWKIRNHRRYERRS